MKFRMFLSAVVALACAGAASGQLPSSLTAQPIVRQFLPEKSVRRTTGERFASQRAPEEVPAPQAAPQTPTQTAPTQAEPDLVPEAEGDGLPCESCGQPCESCGEEPYGFESCGGVDWCGASQGPWYGGMWARTDYLLWWGRGVALVPLVTTSSQSSLGVLSAADTTVVLGNDRVAQEHRSGGRIDFGMWIDPGQDVGIGGNFLAVETAGAIFDLQSNGVPLLARPFFDVTTAMDDSQIVAATNISNGWVNVRTTNDFLGAEAYIREALLRGRRSRIDLLYGYRFARLDEMIAISDATVSTDPGGPIPLGTVIVGRDLFETENLFNGAELGVHFSEIRGPITWDVLVKVALGNVRQNAQVSGNTVVTVPGFDPVFSEGDLYALNTNIGSYHRDRFAVIPELNLNLGYRVTRTLTARAGYTFLLWNRVAQAAQQINQNINPSQISGGLVGEAQPSFSFHNSTYWLQGVNFGLEFRY